MSEVETSEETPEVTSELDAVAEAPARASSRPGLIQLAIKEKTALVSSYMPFIKNGGLFVPTVRPTQLGDPIYLVLTLMDDPNKLAITGKVIWLTPPGVPGRQQGVGIQFADDETGEQARNRIETLVGGSMKGASSHTI